MVNLTRLLFKAAIFFRVRYTVQVLSHSVAAAISTHVAYGGLPEEAQGTANFVETMNNFFDVMNSSGKKGKFV